MHFLMFPHLPKWPKVSNEGNHQHQPKSDIRFYMNGRVDYMRRRWLIQEKLNITIKKSVEPLTILLSYADI